MDWKDVNKELPENGEHKTYLAFLKNITSEGEDHIITVAFSDYGEVKEFRRIGALHYNDKEIKNKSKYPRFSDPYSCDDLDGDYCILTHWAKWNKPE